MVDYSKLWRILAQLDRVYLERNTQIQYYRDLYLMRGRYDEPQPGLVNLKSNLAYTTTRLATAMLSRKTPYLARPMRGESIQEEEQGSRLENLGYVGLLQADKLSRAKGFDLFRHIVPQSFLIDGWAYAEVLLDPDSDWPFRTVLHDPIQVLARKGDSGPDFVFIRTTMWGKDVRERWDVPITGNDEEIIPIVSVWFYDGRQVRNVVALLKVTGSMWINPSMFSYGKLPVPFDIKIKLPTDYEQLGIIRDAIESDLTKIPIVGGPSGGIHWRATYFMPNNYLGTELSGEWGHSFLYAVDHLIKRYDTFISDLAELVDTYIHPTIIVRTRDGHVKEIKIGSNATNYLAQNEAIEVLYVQGTPPPFDYIVKMVERMMFQGTLPESVLATPESVASGFLAGLGDEQANNHLVRAVNSQEFFYQDVIEQYLRQYEKLRPSQVKKFHSLWGVDAASRHFFVDAMPNDVGGFYEMAVKCILATPQQELAQANKWQIFQNMGVASRRQIREEMRFPNPERIRRERLAESVEDNPAVQTARAVHILIEQGLETEALIVAQQLGVPAETSVNRVNPRTGLPERPQPRPEALPPTASQGQPNPEVATAAGVPPAGARLEDMLGLANG